jgi:formylglycine-generating enzyme required for sulfatase activity
MSRTAALSLPVLVAAGLAGQFVAATGNAPVPQTPAGKAKAAAGEERTFEIASGVRMVFCWVPPGTATLGSPATEAHRVNDAAEHEFTTGGFWMGKYEVTQQEWVAVMGKNPSYFRVGGLGGEGLDGIKDTSRFPVEGVSWDDCQAFLKRLNERAGVQAAFGRPVTFKLPHEDEWEYACRGGKGNKQPFYFGAELNGRQANCDGTEPYGTKTKGPYLERTAAVGSYAKEYPHPWNLCDMHGNVYEHCDNLHSKNGTDRVVRGGSWGSNAVNCRSADRGRNAPDERYPFGGQGFRVSGTVGR